MIKQLWRLYSNAAGVFLILLTIGTAYAVFDRHVLIMLAENVYVARDRERDFLRTFATPAPEAVMMLGDSITRSGRFHHVFPDHFVLNYGVGGDTTDMVLARLDTVLTTRPAKIFLMIGTNDVHRRITPAQSTTNVRAILTTLRQALPDTQIYLHPVTPRAPKHQKKIEAINAGYKALAAEMNIPFIDLYTPMLDESGGIKSTLSNDEQHFTGAGYKVWINAIRPYIEED